jgi:hypothetical protein
MSLMAVINLEGVGLGYPAAYTFPVTKLLVENVSLESIISPKPVMAVLVMGLVPTLPFTLVTPVVVTPAFVKMA